MKIGLIVEGGGMKCAYSAAVLDKFLDDGINFDYCIGVSAGSANAASFLAGQRNRNKRFYVDYVDDPDYFGIRSLLKTGNLFNLNHIYRDMSNSGGIDPLNYETLSKNPTQYVIVATDAKTGKPEYFDGHRMKKDNYDLIIASCSLPGACHATKLSNGRKYFDGGVSDSIPVRRALKDGCDKVVVLSTKPRDFVKKPESMRLAYTILCCMHPNTVKSLNNRHIMYKQCQEDMFELEKQGKAFIYCPSKHLPMSTYAMDKEENMNLYKLGLSDYDESRDAFFKFMQKDIAAIS